MARDFLNVFEDAVSDYWEIRGQSLTLLGVNTRAVAAKLSAENNSTVFLPRKSPLYSRRTLGVPSEWMLARYFKTGRKDAYCLDGTERQGLGPCRSEPTTEGPSLPGDCIR